jgi:ankyrin repeat protein
MKFYSLLMGLLIGAVAHAMNYPDKDQFPLHHAAANNDCGILQSLLEHNPKALQLLTMQDGLGRTPLHWAAANGHNSMVSHIVVTFQGYHDDDASTTTLLNQSDYSGRTAAELADANGHESVVENLVYAGARDPRMNGNPRSITPPTEPLVPSSTYTRTAHYYFTKALVGVMMAVIIGTQFLQHTHQGSCSNPD